MSHYLGKDFSLTPSHYVVKGHYFLEGTPKLGVVALGELGFGIILQEVEMVCILYYQKEFKDLEMRNGCYNKAAFSYHCHTALTHH